MANLAFDRDRELENEASSGETRETRRTADMVIP